MPKVALYFPYVAFNYSDDSLSHCLPLFIASCSLVSPGFCCIFTVLFIEYNLKLQPKYPQNGRRDTPPYTTRVVCGASTLAPSALHTRARLSPQMQFLDPPIYLAKIGLLHRSPPSLCRSLFYVDNHVGTVVTACYYHTRALRHVREHVTTETAQRHLVMDRLL